MTTTAQDEALKRAEDTRDAAVLDYLRYTARAVQGEGTHMGELCKGWAKKALESARELAQDYGTVGMHQEDIDLLDGRHVRGW